MTKAELIQINARLAAENADLRAQLSEAQASLARLTKNLSKSTTARSADFNYVDERLARMQAAREEAMATGRCVRV